MKNWLNQNKQYIRKTVTVAWPAVLESFFVAIVGIVDSMMVSNLGEYAVAAVGLTIQPKFIGLAMFIATNVAVSSLAARRKGQGDQEGAGKILLAAVLFTVLAGVMVSILCVVFANPIITFSGSEADTHESAVLYFRIIMGGMLFSIISLVINAAQRGSGNTRIAMTSNLTSNLVNICLNYLLIEGHFGFPALGIKGAAIATVIGTIVACIMSIASLFHKKSFVNISFMIQNKLRPSLEAFKQIFSLASNVFVEQIFLRIGFMSVSIMAAKLGTRAFAVQQVGSSIMSLSFSFGDGMQVAAVTLIGQSLGQKNPALAKKYGAICQRIGNLISVILSVVYLLCGEWFYRMFFTEQESIHMGVSIMQVMVIIVLMQVSQVIYMGCLRGAGDVRFTTMASIISVTIIRPVMSYVFAYGLGLGLVGIWFGVVCDQIARLILTQWRFRSGKWTQIKI
ncbi:MAG TPA: MATE family efflux transporter [Lachnospiraceae bacterium]|nr:MATE family efflux transporter [Lachnospiraceae bacterium]